MIPRIRSAHEDQDFHDSSLIDLQISPQLNSIRAIVSTPDEHGIENLWMLTFSGVLRFEYETVGEGTESDAGPLEVYTIYNDLQSEERARWVTRLHDVGVPRHEAERVWHVVLASSFARGWGRNRQLEGLQIVCRDVRVERAPADYRGAQFRRPRIEADDE